MAERNEKIDQVFAAALEITDAAARLAYLQQACGGDEELCQEVESLLAAHQQAGTFLEEPSPGAPFVSGVAGGPETERAEAETGLKSRAAERPSSSRARSLRGTAERLVKLYEAWGKPDQAAEWKQKLAELEKPKSAKAE